DNGNYAKRYSEGKIADEDCDIFHLAYTEDDLYNYLEDAIAEYYLANKEPTIYEKKSFIFR
ncbi:hypothetical protein, partial [Anaerosporobacter sp.]